MNSETTPTSHTAPLAPVENRPSTSLPTIGGTVQVGEMLKVDVSGITDADGLDNATLTYQWIVNETVIVGSKDAAYTLVIAEDGRTTWLPSEGTVETNIQGATNLTYTVTDAAEGRPIRVRVSFTDDAGNSETLISPPTLMSSITAAPSSHDRVLRTQRVDKPSNLRWRIMVRPVSDDAVTILPPATENCDAQGAICTADGRMLSS